MYHFTNSVQQRIKNLTIHNVYMTNDNDLVFYKTEK